MPEYCKEGTLDDFSVGDKDTAIVGSSEGISEGTLDGVNDVTTLGDVEDFTDGRAEEEMG